MRISTIYGGSNVLNLSATGTNGAAVALSGVEYVIDSTGSSAGVLRRVQVAVPIIQATNILDTPFKQLQIFVRDFI